MKDIAIYFGKQDYSVFGNQADIIHLTVEDDDALNFINQVNNNNKKFISINFDDKQKFINTSNILWFDVKNAIKKEKLKNE